MNSYETKLKNLQRKFSRQKNSSNRREKTRIQINKIYDKMKNIRTHFHWHLANLYCSENQTIIIEDLNVKGMVKNRKLSHSISYASWSSFVTKLHQKAREYRTEIITAPRFFPSSKTCSHCGGKKKHLGLGERMFVCEKCGYEIDRDVNASINLKNLAPSRGSNGHREVVRLTELVFNSISNFVEVSTEEVVEETLLWN
jgi:putative transposase